MKDRITMLRIRLIIQMFLLRNIRKWGRWQKGGMTKTENKEWAFLLNNIEKKYGYRAEVPFYESAK